MSTKVTRNILLFLLGLLGVGALFGGTVLVISPSGKLFGMPLSLLEGSPFNNFLIPGIVLLLALGAFPMLTFFALINAPVSRLAEKLNVFGDMHWAWSFTIYVAFVLIAWIQAEMYFLHAVHWLHSLYMFIAIAILFVALLPKLRNSYKKRSGTS